MLVFEDNTRLLCPYGKHRLKAAEEYGEGWWLVELYLDGNATFEGDLRSTC